MPEREDALWVLLDRDGTLIADRGYTHRVADYQRLPGVVEGLQRLAEGGARFAVVTNQSGIARGFYDAQQFRRFQHHLRSDLAAHGVEIEGSFFCPHLPDAGCECRKPLPGLLRQASEALGFALDRAWLVGDSAGDLAAASAGGCAGAVLVLTGVGRRSLEELLRAGEAAPHTAATLAEAAEIILAARR